MIVSRRQVPNTVAFVLTLLVLSAAALALAASVDKATESSGHHTSTGMAVTLVVLSVLLLLVGERKCATAPTPQSPRCSRRSRA